MRITTIVVNTLVTRVQLYTLLCECAITHIRTIMEISLAVTHVTYVI